jgi:hypothetical protein
MKTATHVLAWGRTRPFAPVRKAQRGQSMAEFLVALAVLLPLFLGVTYAARYGDLQQRATQASRYAAFQRVMQPSDGALSDDKIQDQMRARFFLAPKALNDGRLQDDDSVKSIGDDKHQPALWRDLGGKALLSKPDSVTLAWGDAPLGSLSGGLNTFTSYMGKPWSGARQAHVEVSLVNKMDLSVDTPAMLKIGATTVAAGNGFGSGGSKNTRDVAAKLVPTAMLPTGLTSALTKVLDLALALFEPHGPKIGCIKPDVVATHRLEGAPNNKACL